MGVVVSKWQQFGGGGRGRRRRRSIRDESSSSSRRRLQMASSIAAQEERERSQLRDQEVLRACRSGLSSSCGAINHYSEAAAAAAAAAGAGSNPQLSAWVVVERQLHGESETVERWKQLYLEIKTELDDLIQRTRQLQAAGTCSCSCGCRGEAMELRAKVSAMERDAARRERDMDILRQSLRILTLTNSRTAGNLRRRSRMRLSLCLSS